MHATDVDTFLYLPNRHDFYRNIEIMLRLAHSWNNGAQFVQITQPIDTLCHVAQICACNDPPVSVQVMRFCSSVPRNLRPSGPAGPSASALVLSQQGRHFFLSPDLQHRLAVCFLQVLEAGARTAAVLAARSTCCACRPRPDFRSRPASDRTGD